MAIASMEDFAGFILNSAPLHQNGYQEGQKMFFLWVIVEHKYPQSQMTLSDNVVEDYIKKT